MVDRILVRLPELESLLSRPETAADQTIYRKLVKEHSHIRKSADRASVYRDLTRRIAENRALLDDADAELAEMAEQELPELEEALPAAEEELLLSLLPPDPDDDRNAVVEIRAGTGGDEAALFAGDLFRMYCRYAESRGWRTGIVDASPSELGGYKEVIFTVEGENVYGWLRYESGTHRVQRVPETEAQGRIHTSAATVAVFPEAQEEDELDIPADEIRIDIFRSSGPGGQSVNTTDSAVRITHLPTGVTVQCQDEKSQHRNREKAFGVLKARILDLKRQEDAARQGAERRSLIGTGDRSGRIRTYNFPQSRLTDHRIGLSLYSLDRIIEGELADVVEPLRQHAQQEKMQAHFKDI
ncbi:MAG: peptide chain release factor 1 [Kiritimatiellia bacterium]